MAGKSDISTLRAYFNELKTSQKKEFIKNLQQKLNGINTGKYAEFLSECIQDYNRELQTLKKNAAPNAASKEDSSPDISSESFAIAFASMISGKKPIAIGPRLVGTWQMKSKGKIFYYKFNDDGTFETNAVEGQGIIQGHYKIGMEDDILMEPHELLQVISMMMTVSGHILTIFYADGSACDYFLVYD
jgi:hypothetical protein